MLLISLTEISTNQIERYGGLDPSTLNRIGALREAGTGEWGTEVCSWGAEADERPIIDARTNLMKQA